MKILWSRIKPRGKPTFFGSRFGRRLMRGDGRFESNFRQNPGLLLVDDRTALGRADRGGLAPSLGALRSPTRLHLLLFTVTGAAVRARRNRLVRLRVRRTCWLGCFSYFRLVGRFLFCLFRRVTREWTRCFAFCALSFLFKLTFVTEEWQVHWKKYRSTQF